MTTFGDLKIGQGFHMWDEDGIYTEWEKINDTEALMTYSTESVSGIVTEFSPDYLIFSD